MRRRVWPVLCVRFLPLAAIGLAGVLGCGSHVGSDGNRSRGDGEPSDRAIAVESVAARAAGRKWAVVIGINKYLDPRIASLRYCVADAHRLAETLAAKCGYEEKRILVIADDQPQDHLLPLGINLRHQIVQWLTRAEQGDTVLVSFSGHGFLDSQGQGYLAPKDCEKHQLGLTGFRTDDLRNMLTQCVATQKILILDCCHAGSAKEVGGPGPSSQEVGLAFQKAEGLITLASCRKDEVSREWDAKQQGLFTYFVTQGLAGSADFDRNAIVDSDELYRYTVDGVSIAAQRELNAQQTPVRLIGPDVVGVFALARLDHQPHLRPAIPSAPTNQPPETSPKTPSGRPSREITNSIGMKLVLIPAGEFQMGSPESEQGRDDDEGPVHRVRITKPFYLGQYEVTQAEYERVMGSNPSHFSVSGLGTDTVSGQDTSRFPVESVSWENAMEFCRKLSQQEGEQYRLPTEAEWEYACRARTIAPFSFGSALNSREANCEGSIPYGTQEKGPILKRTTQVGSYLPNAFGLYDMHGNVREWCADWYHYEYYANSPVDDPPGSSNRCIRVMRGGDWIGSAADCRSANRSEFYPDFRNPVLGFRVARVAAE
jgi:formylglycine-generating enzyme required for sulfatase activity